MLTVIRCHQKQSEVYQNASEAYQRYIRDMSEIRQNASEDTSVFD